MKVFIAGLCHETSAFSPVPTNRQSFEEFVAYRPRDLRIDDAGLALNGYGIWAREAAAAGYELAASNYHWAQPSGPCVRADYEALRNEILSDLERAGPVAMVLLFLHGAQMADGYADCEGDLLTRVRAIVGPDVFVGALLDLHANVTEQMIEAASALVACRNYPHTDFDERALQLYALGVRAAAGDVLPVMRLQRLPMVGLFYTTEPMMAAANAAALDLEQCDGVLSVSLIHGFMWADMPEMGAGVLVILDGNCTDDLDFDITAEVRKVAAVFFGARGETRALRQSIGPILDQIEAAGPDPANRPFVVADTDDNAGGGAGSDSTFILEAVLARGLRGYALALLWDPIAVEFATIAGVGTAFKLRLGGKTGPQAGRPLDVVATVLAIRRNLTQFGIGFSAPMGTVVALEIAGNIVIVNDVRGQVFSPTCFTDLGVEPSRQRAIIVKSTQHFHDQFEPLAREILYCETAGSLSLVVDPARYRHLRRPIWPVDDVAFVA